MYDGCVLAGKQHRIARQNQRPIINKNGRCKGETKDYVYVLFPYIDGVTPQTTPLSVSQQKELAELVGELHRHSSDIPFDLSSIQETYEIPCAELLNMPHGEIDGYDLLMRAIDKVHALAENVKAAKPPFVLCHTDIHGWNIMQSDKLILIDWETIKLAPAELDLYTFWGDWYLGGSKRVSYWDTFLPIYRRIHPEYVVREEILRFYQLRRRIEDINDSYKQYLYDDMTEYETRKVISDLERECASLDVLMR